MELSGGLRPYPSGSLFYLQEVVAGLPCLLSEKIINLISKLTS